MEVLSVIIGILSIAGAIVLTVLFFSKKSEGKFTGVMGWIYDFVNYKETIYKYILIGLKWFWKSIYLIGAISVTLSAFVYPISMMNVIGVGRGIALIFAILIIGNIMWRLVCELAPIVVLFSPRVIRKFFHWLLSVPHRPRPYIIKKDDSEIAAGDDIHSWKYFAKK